MEGYFVELPKQVVDGRINYSKIEIEFAENDNLEYERNFLPKGIVIFLFLFIKLIFNMTFFY